MESFTLAQGIRLQDFNPGDRSGASRPFFCDGNSSLALRALSTGGLRGESQAWFRSLAQACATVDSAAEYLTKFGHKIPLGYRQSRERAQQLLAWMAGPVWHRFRGEGEATASSPQLADLLSQAALGEPLELRQSLTLPIAVVHAGKGAIVPLIVELVSTQADALSHFPSCRVGFVPFDDEWLDAFSAGVHAGQAIAAHASGRPAHQLGWGLAVRWTLALDRLWPELADAHGTVESVAHLTLAGPSASAAFGLAVAQLLAREEGWVPGVAASDADKIALCELRALPLEEILVSAEVDAAGGLSGVGGLRRSGGGLPPKLEAARYRQGNRLAVVGLAHGDATDVDHLDDGKVPIVRAGHLHELARALRDTTFPSRYGAALPLPPVPAVRDLPPVDTVFQSVANRLAGRASGEGSCIVVEAPAGSDAAIARSWIDSSTATRQDPGVPPRLAGWAIGGRALGAPWNNIEAVLDGLEHSARMNLCLARGNHTPVDLRGRVSRLLSDCSKWTRMDDHPPVLLLIGGAGDFAEELRDLLPDRTPQGVRVVLVSRPVNLAREGWESLHVGETGDESRSIFWLAGTPDGWPASTEVLAAEMTSPGTGIRLEFEPDAHVVARWKATWLENVAKFAKAVEQLDPGLRWVFTHWPGGEDTDRHEAILTKARRGGHGVLLLCARPATAAASLCAHVLDEGQEPQPVQLATLPGLDRGSYVLLVETCDAASVLRTLAGAEACVPAVEPRRWWLDLPGIKAPTHRLEEVAADSPDARWVARFPNARPLGCLIRHADGAVDVARFACALAPHAVVIAAPYRDWLDQVSAELSRCGRGHLRAQVGNPAPSTSPRWFHTEPEEDLEAFLLDAARCSAGFAAQLRASRAIWQWQAQRKRGATPHGSARGDFDIAAAAKSLTPDFPQAAAELLDIVAGHAPSYLPQLAELAMPSDVLRPRFIECIANAPDAFADAAASAALRVGLRGPLAATAPKLRLLLALAWLRDGRTDLDVFEEVRAGIGSRKGAQLDAIHAADGRLASTLDSVRLAARAGRRGEQAIERMLSRRDLAAAGLDLPPQLGDSLFWAGAWCTAPGNPSLRKVMEHPVLRRTLGLASAQGVLTPFQISEARLGIAAPWREC